jgi:hypothetical protein
MIRVSRTFTRPNTLVAWHHETTAGLSVSAYRASAYGNKMSGQSVQLSSDGLSLTYHVNWASQADFDASRADSQFMAGQSSRQSYNARNGIVESGQTITQI